VKLGFGMVTAQRPPWTANGHTRVYADLLELAAAAETLGFDSFWLSEHHFVDDGYMPSLLPVAAAVAARTESIGIGTGLVLAPFHDPVRLAEDAATVDLISGGRLLLGLGAGWRAAEFAGFGVPSTRLGSVLEDTVGVLRAAWGDGLVPARSSRAAVSVTPKPDRPGGPPIWIGARSAPGIRRTARIADGFLAARVTPSRLAAQVAALHAELDAAGRPRDTVAVGLHVPVFVAASHAWETVREYFHYLEWKYDDMATSDSARTQTAPVPTLEADREAAMRPAGLFGTPDEVINGIKEYAIAVPAPLHFIARMYWPGMKLGTQLAAMQLFASDVLPALR
jgi:alkanesulfonate monooxygenase SsuD/methylene tetrahydromethanopterin reductase-like flavin-dependent oxidoreductase (luciferase family)